MKFFRLYKNKNYSWVRTVTRILIQLYVSIKMKENKKKKIKIKI